jgi:hypothetical protein
MQRKYSFLICSHEGAHTEWEPRTLEFLVLTTPRRYLCSLPHMWSPPRGQRGCFYIVLCVQARGSLLLQQIKRREKEIYMRVIIILKRTLEPVLGWIFC